MKLPFVLGLPIALAACTQAPALVPSEALAPSANPQIQLRNAPVADVLAGYSPRPVKGPEDWRKLNQQQSPAKAEEN